MLRFAARAAGTTIALGLLVGALAGCETVSPTSPDFTFTPAPAAPTSPAPSAAALIPVAPPSPAPHVVPPGLRPMTAWEKQYRQNCIDGVVSNGCELYSDRSMRLQGIDPES